MKCRLSLLVVVVALTLSACGRTGDATAQTTSASVNTATAAAPTQPAAEATATAEVNQGEMSTRMVECLREHGQTAQIAWPTNEEGVPQSFYGAVELLYLTRPFDPAWLDPETGYIHVKDYDVAAEDMALDWAFVLYQAGGLDAANNAQSWIAPVDSRAFGSRDGLLGKLGEIWDACATQSEFQQPDQYLAQAMEQTAIRDRTAAGLVLTQCGRDAGFAWLADPVPEEPTFGSIVIPSGVSEEDFRAFIDECYSPAHTSSTGRELPFNPLDILSEVTSQES